MITINFKDVGQGDSILLEWKDGDNSHLGIIDCHEYNGRNAILEHIIGNQIKQIDFIILSHLHYDHYSGFLALLNHCIDHKITINRFLHTIPTEYAHILNLMQLSVNEKYLTVKFLKLLQEAVKSKVIKDIDDISHNFKPLILYSGVELSFLAPNGADYLKLANQRSNYEHKRSTSVPNFNLVATIIKVTNTDEGILLTSDAPTSSFKRIKGNIKQRMKLVQIPHHGSRNNHYLDFWTHVDTIDECPAVLSIGDEPTDKLPNLDVVEDFHKLGYFLSSTNYVYGIKEKYFGGQPSTDSDADANLGLFGTDRTENLRYTDRFKGDKLYNIPL